MRVYKLNVSTKGKYATFKGSTEVPLKVVVVMGKRHVVGIGELGDKYAEVDKRIMPFFPITYDINSVLKELLTKLGLTSSEINDILAKVQVEEF